MQLAMKLAPDRKKFMEVLGGTGDVNADIEKFCTTFPPFLEENHKFLVSTFANHVTRWSVSSRFLVLEPFNTINSI